MVILTVLLFPTTEHEISLHSFVPSSDSFISFFFFNSSQSIQFYTSLVQFIPKNFIFDVILNGVVFLLSHFSALVYRNATDFCISLILWSAPLLNLLLK